jgi:uncharacterized membrane protein required for colicin V production
MSLTWPDLVIGAICLLFALKGFKRGFVSELAGAVALGVAILAAFWYPGSLDDIAQTVTHTGPGSAHVIGMVAFSALVYLACMALSLLLGRFAKLPIIGTGNAILGAGVGICKALVGVWVVLYVVLFFPLSRDLREDLHRSSLVAFVAQPNAGVDSALRGTLPWFVKPLVIPLFDRHRV